MRRAGVAAGAVSAVVCLAAAGVASGTEDPGRATAPRMEFMPPPPGSYKLQKIQPVSEAVLLDSSGLAVRLSALTQGKITLLTFFYTYCVDPLGCPFAHTTLAGLRDRVTGDRALAGRVRFVSVSLDPTHDTPPAIASYQRGLGPERPRDAHLASYAEDVSDRRPWRGTGNLYAGLLATAGDVQRHQDAGARGGLTALIRESEPAPPSTTHQSPKLSSGVAVSESVQKRHDVLDVGLAQCRLVTDVSIKGRLGVDVASVLHR